MDQEQFVLTPQQLRPRTNLDALAFGNTSEIEPLDRIIGQDRAIQAIDFGIDIDSAGYNIFAVGPAGSGRTTVVRQFLEQRASLRPAPQDWCYVNNFRDARYPQALALLCGESKVLRSEMDALIVQLRRDIPMAFEGEVFEQRRREIILAMQRQQMMLYQELEAYLRERSFTLIRGESRMVIAPIAEGQPLTDEQYEKLPDKVKTRYENFRPEIQEQFGKTMRLTRQLERNGRQALEKVTRDIAGFVVDQSLADLMSKYANTKVAEFLTAVREDAISNAQNLIAPAEAQPLLLGREAPRDRFLENYRVNVLTESQTCDFAPIVIEDNPTYANLIGRIEHRAEFGTMVTDFTQIRAGSLHRANGGYLVVEAKNLLSNPLAWDALKRSLRSRQIKIEEMVSFYGVVTTVSLEPEPIPLDVKVVIIGDEQLYELLYTYDEDFAELFKIKAQFVSQVTKDAEILEDYARFVAGLCRKEGLLHFTRDAVAYVIDAASRLVEDQKRLSTRMAQVADIIREAAYYAQKAGHNLVEVEDVRRSMMERIYRQDHTAERYRETIEDAVIKIDVQGSHVGQINGLSVIQALGWQFGIPSRVSAQTFIGRRGVVSIDREVKMSGPIHDKGQLILSSYLEACFAQKSPLSISATITFEQLYTGVEGDSASSTELYAILSSLAEAPIRQDLAVTGSVNQFGQIQAIGGVNAKVEGFFDVCQRLGLTGTQGVLIPSANVQHLMLREDVVEAVEAGKFRVYAVDTIEQGIELLTGVPAGEVDEQGNYPEGSIFARVSAKLEEYRGLLEKIAQQTNAAPEKALRDCAQDKLEEPPSA
ncbi:MAG: AAA family ATPase [Chloroflexi bacterium]|nr:AAA family ATPase [Chloroflexota bacterium]